MLKNALDIRHHRQIARYGSRLKAGTTRTIRSEPNPLAGFRIRCSSHGVLGMGAAEGRHPYEHAGGVADATADLFHQTGIAQIDSYDCGLATSLCWSQRGVYIAANALQIARSMTGQDDDRR